MSLLSNLNPLTWLGYFWYGSQEDSQKTKEDEKIRPESEVINGVDSVSLTEATHDGFTEVIRPLEDSSSGPVSNEVENFIPSLRDESTPDTPEDKSPGPILNEVENFIPSFLNDAAETNETRVCRVRHRRKNRMWIKQRVDKRVRMHKNYSKRAGWH